MKLADIAKTQPQAAYAAFVHGERHKFTYFMRTINGMEEFLAPLDKVIAEVFLPALLGKDTLPNHLRSLFALPLRFGGLAIPILSEMSQQEYHDSLKVTGPLASIIVNQGTELPDKDEVKRLKAEVTSQKNMRMTENAEKVEHSLPPNTARHMKQASEKGASGWLSVLPLADQGFSLSKGEFRDAIALRYGENIPDLPSKCPCGEVFNINHALNCKRGGFVIMRHNDVRDFEANLLRDICNDVETEPPLQPLDGEVLNGGATGDEASPDIRAKGFWRKAQNAFFDVMITNTECNSQQEMSTDAVFSRHEGTKKRKYNDRIMNVEHGTFTPLIFAINGGVGPECKRYHQHLAERIAEKNGTQYGKVISWIRCKLSFVVLRACLTCLRGSRPHRTYRERNSYVPEDIALAGDEAGLVN